MVDKENTVTRIKKSAKKTRQSEEFFGPKWYTFPPLRNVLIAGIIAIFVYFLAKLSPTGAVLEPIFYIAAILIGSFYWAKEAIEDIIKEKIVGIGILVIAAVVGAILLKLWNEAVFLSVLYSAAEGLEEFTYSRTRHSIRSLLKLTPEKAVIVRNGEESVISAKELKIGDVFIVRAGSSVPTDGVIVRGGANIDESTVTGESFPACKGEGDSVFAGTISIDGTFEVRTTTLFVNNTISKIIRLVEAAQEKKGKTQLFIERFGKVYSPLVLITALVLVIVPHILGVPHSEWNVRAISFLVAAAPCALIMSTPVTIAAGIGHAGKKGVLIKGGVYLENLGKINTVLFDKTGTLTIGRMVLADIIPVGITKRELLSIVYSIEKLAGHPIAKAITEAVRASKPSLLSVSEFRVIPGFGAEGVIDGEVIYVGKVREGADKNFVLRMKEPSKLVGKTTAIVKRGSKVIGLLGLTDEVRPETKTVINALYKKGVHLAMLTGDNKNSGARVGDKLGIKDVRTDLKPADKLEIVEDFRKKFGFVAMIGDGINDAPALAAADVGIAMGTVGTDAAIESADVALLSENLKNIVYLLDLGRKVRKINTENIIFSIITLGILIPLTLFGIINIPIAVIFHEASELIAVSNGVRASL